MLFGACNCTPAALGPSRRGLLCAGGAGFVTALVGTLIGSGRTAHAKTLSGPVPEIDRLNVTIVDDIMVRRNVPTQKLDGLTVERAQPNEVPDKDWSASGDSRCMQSPVEAMRCDRFWWISDTIQSRCSITWRS